MSHCKTDQARVEIDKLVSINIPNDTALARFGRERVESHERGRDERLVLFDQGPGFRTRRCYHNLRIFRSWHRWRRAHVSSTNKIAQRIRRVRASISQSYLDRGETRNRTVLSRNLFGPNIHRMDQDVFEKSSPEHLNRLNSLVNRLATSPHHDLRDSRIEQGHAGNHVIHRRFLANPHNIRSWLLIFETIVDFSLGQYV